MSYVYLSDVSPQATTPPPAPTQADPQKAAAALETNAKALELSATAMSAVNPSAANALRQQAANMRTQAEKIRSELGGLSTVTKVGIGVALIGAAAGGFYWYKNKGQQARAPRSLAVARR